MVTTKLKKSKKVEEVEQDEEVKKSIHQGPILDSQNWPLLLKNYEQINIQQISKEWLQRIQQLMLFVMEQSLQFQKCQDLMIKLILVMRLSQLQQKVKLQLLSFCKNVLGNNGFCIWQNGDCQCSF